MTQPEPGYTLGPEDMPLQLFTHLERELRENANGVADSARKAVAAGDLSGAVARYEAALTRYLIAARVSDTVRRAASDLAQTHEQRVAEEHGKEPGEHIEMVRADGTVDRFPADHITEELEDPYPVPGTAPGTLPGDRFGEGGKPDDTESAVRSRHIRVDDEAPGVTDEDIERWEEEDQEGTTR